MAGDGQRTSGPSASHTRKVRRLEQELRETVERYELIFKATYDVLYDLNIKTGKVVWNKALATQYGYAKSDTTSTLEWWVEHIHPDDALRVEANIYDWMASDKDRWESEYRFRRANGTYVFVRDRGFVTRDKTGAPLRIIGSLLDITAQKKLDNAKDEFISLVSHQLRTPLTVIRIYGEMLGSGFFGHMEEQQASHVGRMTAASIHLIKLVDDILNVSRIELGDFKITPSLTNVNHIIAEYINDIRPVASDKGVDICFTPDARLAKVYIDPGILTQILDNFLTNAIRYTRPTSGQIDVSFAKHGKDYQLRVKDNGIGIPKSAQAHVFDRFYRASNAVNIEEQGTGLGLYLVQLMTKALGGQVWFESSAAKGTAFYLTIPVDSVAAPDALAQPGV